MLFREAATGGARGRRGDMTPASDGSPGPQVELALASASVNEVARKVDQAGARGRYLGLLAARLVELGEGSGNGLDADHRQAFADAMRHLKRRLEGDPEARHVFVTHSRTYGRPAGQVITGADDWVVPMVEAEVGRLADHDKLILRRNVITRIGRQHDVHPDFRPLVLRLAIEDETLACLATAQQAPAAAGEMIEPNNLLAALAGPFVDVVMADADDGIELEAAAWDYAQRTVAHQVATTGDDGVAGAARTAASLLALIDTSRTLAARQCPAQAHAGQATRTAVAEFVFSNLMLLATRPEAALANAGGGIGRFVLRDFVGRSKVDPPKAIFDAWAQGRPSRRLFLDLLLVILLTRRELPGLPAGADGDVATAALDLLDRAEGHRAARDVVRAVDGGWQVGDWAGMQSGAA